ncbi:MAG: hypothetical protein WBN42_13780, partial [Ignavibacteriaceae bacterium]
MSGLRVIRNPRTVNSAGAESGVGNIALNARLNWGSEFTRLNKDMNIMKRPTAEEVCRAIELMLTLSDDHSEELSKIYMMVHCREGMACRNPHEDWVRDFWKTSEELESANLPPSKQNALHISD